MPGHIPHSIFLGRVPREGEPYWLPEDSEKALEWLRYEKTLCPECKMPDSEWLDENGEAHRPPRWEVDTRRCPCCKNVTLFMKSVRATIGDDENQLAGLQPVIVPYGTKRRRELDDDDDW